jgi:O-antigen/teichoic acid export membrane protein
MASTKRRFAINVLMNWAATAVNMVVPFFLSPFVVRRLGAVQYGIWILSVSTVSYLALMDLGLRSVVVRFVSKSQAEGRADEGTAVVGAALWLRLLIACGVALLSVGLGLAAPHMFRIPVGLMHAAQVTMLLCGMGVAVTLVTGVFGAVLTAIHRFDLLSTITMGQTAARAIGFLLILRSGRGLIALACWELTVIALSGAVTCVVALKIYPACRVRVKRPSGDVMRRIWSYSLTTFVFMIAVQIVINTDSLVIGAFLSVGMVTYYTIGSSLVQYASQVASAVSSTFVPMASNLEASGRMEDLQQMLLRGTQGMLGLVLPTALALIFRGRTFISIWMGPQYGQISETVLQILTISLFFAMGDATGGAIMMAIDKHKPVARWAVLEAVLNLGLSIVLVKTVGLYGVAWGTSLSMAFTHLCFWPRYVNKVLGMPGRRDVWEGWGRITLCSLPFGFVCFLTDRYWTATNLPVFFGQIAITLPVYVGCVALLYRHEVKTLWQRRQMARLIAAS